MKERKIFGIILFIFMWQIISLFLSNPAIPNVTSIGESIVKIFKSGRFLKDLLSTFEIVFFGEILSVLLGLFIGIIVSEINTINDLVMPTINILRNIPAIALFPILLTLFGIGNMSRIVVIFWTSFPAMLLSVINGINSIDKEVVEAAELDGANKAEIVRSIKIPLAVPEIINGIRIGIGSGFIAVVVAEMLGAYAGLGYMIVWSTNAFRYSETYSYILLIGIIGFLVNYVIEKLQVRKERKIR